MLRKAAVLATSALVLVIAYGAGTAYAAVPFYSDGSTFSGQINYGPPPTDPFFAQGEDCQTDIVDPSGFVYMTEHFVYGTTPPPAGVVPVTDDASLTFPYHGVAPAEF